MNLTNADIFIDALAVLLDGGLRSLRATNGGELPVVSEAYRIGIVRADVNAEGAKMADLT